MWFYIIGYVVCFIILSYLYWFFNNKLTYEKLFQFAFISIISWVGVFLEIIFILSFLFIAFDSYLSEKEFLSEKDFWDKEIFKKK